MASRVQAGGNVSVAMPLLENEAKSAATERKSVERVEVVAEQASAQRNAANSAPRASLARRGLTYLGNNPKCAAVGCAAATALAFVGMYFLSKMAVG